MIKAAFFDIDGTLISAATNNLIPETAKEALVALRSSGVKLFISSGRVLPEMPECVREGFSGFEEGFDGYISLNGSYCIDHKGVYNKDVITKEEVREFYRLVEQGEFSAIALFPDRTFANELSPEILGLSKEVGITYHAEDFSQVLTQDVYQFCAFIPPEKDAWLQNIMSGCIITRWCDVFCDVVPATSSKHKGIAATCKRYGFLPEECIAFGDGGNDVTMLKFCGIGVAMGNGTDEAKNAADYVTTDIDKDGIAHALRHFELID